MTTLNEAILNLRNAVGCALIEIGRGIAEPFATKAAPQLTADMIREAEAHTPLALAKPERWEWMADRLNKSLEDPGAICQCCNVTADGDIMDHLPTAAPASGYLPIERDTGYDRSYIPLPGGWEVQTKGKGSTFRICEPGDDPDRLAIPDSPYLHDTLERMARDINATWYRIAVAPPPVDDSHIDALADEFMSAFNCEAELESGARIYDNDKHHVVEALRTVLRMKNVGRQGSPDPEKPGHPTGNWPDEPPA
jgi:hypothetical protein